MRIVGKRVSGDDLGWVTKAATYAMPVVLSGALGLEWLCQHDLQYTLPEHIDVQVLAPTGDMVVVSNPATASANADLGNGGPAILTQV